MTRDITVGQDKSLSAQDADILRTGEHIVRSHESGDGYLKHMAHVEFWLTTLDVSCGNEGPGTRLITQLLARPVFGRLANPVFQRVIRDEATCDDKVLSWLVQRCERDLCRHLWKEAKEPSYAIDSFILAVLGRWPWQIPEFADIARAEVIRAPIGQTEK